MNILSFPFLGYGPHAPMGRTDTDKQTGCNVASYVGTKNVHFRATRTDRAALISDCYWRLTAECLNCQKRAGASGEAKGTGVEWPHI